MLWNRRGNMERLSRAACFITWMLRNRHLPLVLRWRRWEKHQATGIWMYSLWTAFVSLSNTVGWLKLYAGTGRLMRCEYGVSLGWYQRAGNQSTWSRIFPGAIVCTSNLTGTAPVSNLGLCGERPVTDPPKWWYRHILFIMVYDIGWKLPLNIVALCCVL